MRIQHLWIAVCGCMIFVTMSKFIQGLETGHFQAISLWTTDQYQLNLMKVKSFWTGSAVQCCSFCYKDSMCFGAAWNDQYKICQMVMSLDLISYVDFSEMNLWRFFIKSDFMCNGQSE